MREGSEERRRVSLLEIEARLRRLALSVGEARPVPSTRKPSIFIEEIHSTHAEKMAAYIARHYAQPLTARMIGQHVGLHPNYEMALFNQTFGTTLVKYLTEHRLSHAQRMLATTQQSIVQIAFASGFGSLSRFNEVFRRSFGCTPRE